ncbi:DUF4914 family protein [Alkalitalea saponilacus]|uniref:DUF4914 domain-containing protein n=1 Tax=Alkalitalea saponilacus TaxID=889453 RepID=A0A1T5CMB6_9BACT|nr:DUF4914 family protein [Alkalitalea saponilacus]ASB49904.1 DUF4914 domain-containing protein [Alkalitalea saponilacus]SKB60290.1 protein of unknown function [Alkalitalea saponilacus]
MSMLKELEKQGVKIPAQIKDLLVNAPKVHYFNTTDELVDASVGGAGNSSFEVKYDVPGKGEYTEAVVHRVSNGISANYTESYMRRRDPGTMLIADDKPSDKKKFKDVYGYEFEDLRKDTFEWLKGQELAVFMYYAGNYPVGIGGIAIAPANAGFFALGLAFLQKILPMNDLPKGFRLDSAIYVAPPFRHTHFEGKQRVIHNRLDDIHELFSYNLYPGPSAKKGLYGVLITRGEAEGWVTAHCSTVQATNPYDNTTTFMHEGASGGGKSEMLQMVPREPDGQVLIGRNTISGEERHINIPLFCTFAPVTDDMALCHPSYQKGNGKLTVADAENAWFIRVDGVHSYGDDPVLEKLTLNPPEPVLFLNIDTNPNGTAMIWNHIEDEPGKKCPNPRVILPRHIVNNAVNKNVTVDIRSFGVRTPPSSLESPNYGIFGLFHILPPALAWLWRLVSPRGHANPSIVGTDKMSSEGVGSYWPFATGKRVAQANLLLEQIISTPRVRYTIAPNQHIGVWKVDFKPQLLMREYLTRRGNAKFVQDQYQAARCPLLGYELNYLTLEGNKIPSRFLKVYKQPEVGVEGYDKGAEMLYDFFKQELQQYLQPELLPLGRKIIEACLEGASVERYNELLPMEYKYAFLKKNK